MMSMIYFQMFFCWGTEREDGNIEKANTRGKMLLTTGDSVKRN